MKHTSGSLYAQREERLSLAEEMERHKGVPSVWSGDLQKKMNRIRSRHLWLRRFALAVVLLYALGLTAFITMIMFRGKPSRASSAPVASSPTTTQAKPPVLAKPDPYSVGGLHLAIQNWKDAGDRLRDARTWTQKNRRDMAAALLQEGLKDSPENVALLFELAQLNFDKRDFARTRELLQHVLCIEPNHKTAGQMLATTYLFLGLHEQALTLADWILEGAPDSDVAHRVAGLAQLKAKRLDQAVIHFRKWVARAPNDQDAQRQYADTLMGLKDYEKAGAIYENLLKNNSAMAEVYHQLAICYAQRAMVDKSVATLTQALCVIGAPQVATWFKDSGFDGIRTHKLFTVFERQVITPTLATKAMPSGETRVDLESTFDQKGMKQLQDALQAAREKSP